jgi:NADPH:quinone reductase-like Zn-dependent oxidoreductase
VVGTASPANHDYLRSLGALPVAYGQGLAARVLQIAPQGVDAALDASGRGSLPTLIDLTAHPDRIVTLADPSAATRGVRYMYDEPPDLPGILTRASTAVLSGHLTMPIAHTYSLADAGAAHRDSQAGHVRGKLIIFPI